MDEEERVKKLAVIAGNVHDSQVVGALCTGSKEAVYTDSAYASQKLSEELKRDEG